MDSRLLARLARRGGDLLVDLAVGRLFPDDEAAARKAAQRPKRSMTAKVAGAALARAATRSVPVAIVVTGGMLAKRLSERKRAKQALPKPVVSEIEADEELGGDGGA